MFDPYAESNSTRNKLIALVLLLACLWAVWNFGFVEKIIPNVLPKSKWTQKREPAQAQSATPPTTPTLSPAPIPKPQ
jgi:hypothetical protein